MNSITVQEIKRRGIAAVDDALIQGPVHVIKNNRPQYVVLTEQSYKELLEAQHEATYHRIKASLEDAQANHITYHDSVDALMQHLDHSPNMTWTLATTTSFDRRARKFLAKHPDLRNCFAKTL